MSEVPEVPEFSMVAKSPARPDSNTPLGSEFIVLEDHLDRLGGVVNNLRARLDALCDSSRANSMKASSGQDTASRSLVVDTLSNHNARLSAYTDQLQELLQMLDL